MGSKSVDYNTEDFMGYSKIQANLKTGRRHSVADAFLLPVENRKNLKVLTSARVVKLLIDPRTKEAYGVEYIKRRRRYRIKAKKEVILAAGVFNSPQLLMLAGNRKKYESHIISCNIKLFRGRTIQSSTRFRNPTSYGPTSWTKHVRPSFVPWIGIQNE